MIVLCFLAALAALYYVSHHHDHHGGSAAVADPTQVAAGNVVAAVAAPLAILWVIGSTSVAPELRAARLTAALETWLAGEPNVVVLPSYGGGSSPEDSLSPSLGRHRSHLRPVQFWQSTVDSHTAHEFASWVLPRVLDWHHSNAPFDWVFLIDDYAMAFPHAVRQFLASLDGSRPQAVGNLFRIPESGRWFFSAAAGTAINRRYLELMMNPPEFPNSWEAFRPVWPPRASFAAECWRSSPLRPMDVAHCFPSLVFADLRRRFPGVDPDPALFSLPDSRHRSGGSPPDPLAGGERFLVYGPVRSGRGFQDDWYKRYKIAAGLQLPPKSPEDGADTLGWAAVQGSHICSFHYVNPAEVRLVWSIVSDLRFRDHLRGLPLGSRLELWPPGSELGRFSDPPSAQDVGLWELLLSLPSFDSKFE